jgi:hypothetical protein
VLELDRVLWHGRLLAWWTGEKSAPGGGSVREPAG